MDPVTLSIIKQLLLAALLGGAIGVERRFRRKPAGLRTHSLVALGACLFVILSMHAGFEGYRSFDPSRVLSQIVVGIGFLGAGLIFHRENAVQGLTTAAGLWVTAAIGAAVGLGLFAAAVSTTIIALCIFFILFFFEKKIPQNEL